MSDSNETVTISKAEYYRLRLNCEKFEMLEAAGVDNWDGCDYAFNGECGESLDETRVRIEKEIYG